MSKPFKLRSDNTAPFKYMGSSPIKQTEDILSVSDDREQTVSIDKSGDYYTIHEGDSVIVPEVHLSGGNEKLAIGDYVIETGEDGKKRIVTQ